MEILNTIDNVIQEIAKAKAVLVAVLDKHTANVAKLKADQDALASAEVALTIREEAAKKVEDVVALEQKGNDLLKQAREERITLIKESQDFKAVVAEDQKSIADARQEILDDRTMLKKNFDSLHKQQADFAKEKEDYKLKLAKGLVDRVG